MKYFRIGVMVFVFLGGAVSVSAQKRVDVQKPSRTEAIARIAELYPHSDKSPEQIYDEGQAWNVVRMFSHRFTYRDFDALMGPVYKDTSEVVASRRLDPPIEPKKLIGPSAPTGENPQTWIAPDEPAYHDTTYAQARAEVKGKQDVNKAPIQAVVQSERTDRPERSLLSSAAKDYTIEERRDMKRAYFDAMRNLPTDVRIALYPKKVTVHGQSATVEAEFGYEVLGKPTMRSASFVKQSKKPIQLQMHRDGADWVVSNLNRILQQVVRDIAN